MYNSINTDKKSELYKQAQLAFKKGAVVKAMKILYDLHELDPQDAEILNELVVISLHLKSYEQVIINLQKLIRLEPLKISYYDQLASIYSKNNDWKSACHTYHALLLQRPKSPEAHFNLAYYLRKAGDFEEAIESYEKSLSHGISKPEEVYLNIAVIYSDELRQEAKAEVKLLQAIKLNKEYIPALYNLANIYEDRGDKEKTLEYFEAILLIKPDHAKALARVVNLKEFKDKNDPQLIQLSQLSKAPDIDFGDKVDICFALGKSYNDCKEFDLSFKYYSLANQLNALEMENYNKDTSEKYFNSIIEHFSNEWISSNSQMTNESPVFICGLFRTGSTLVEQILASHPSITAGGERDFFVRKISKLDKAFPLGLSDMPNNYLREMRDNYSKQTQEIFSEDTLVTDKRPDNFLYVGLIKTIFPKAKIIYTVRDAVDNCLSIYFTRLSSAQNYAVDLDSIAHYLDQQKRLLDHWKSLFGDDLLIVNYDEMISDLKTHIEKTLNYINLDWNDDCLNFHELKNTVKTASVWQVRKPLYSQSSGRWKNFEQHIAPLLSHYNK